MSDSWGASVSVDPVYGPIFGTTVTANYGVVAPTTAAVTFQWFRENGPIVGATSASYTLGLADISHRLLVLVGKTKPGYQPMTRISNRTDTVTVADMVPGSVSVAGVYTVGSTLTTAVSGWGASTLSYQWCANDQPIPGATATSYLIQPADSGKAVQAIVTATQPGYAPFITGTWVAQVHPVGKFTVKSTGVATFRTGSATLNVSRVVWGPAPVTYTYQWLRNGAVIDGARAQRYLSVNDGARYTVVVTGSAPGYLTTSTTAG